MNEQTENCLYAEGSLICRLLMGTIGLRKVRQNRVLLVTEDRPDAPNVVDQTINCAEGARATLGMDISEVMVLEKELSMQTGVADSGRVTGRVERLGRLLDMLAANKIPVMAYHFAWPGYGHVGKAGDGFRYYPEPMNMQL